MIYLLLILHAGFARPEWMKQAEKPRTLNGDELETLDPKYKGDLYQPIITTTEFVNPSAAAKRLSQTSVDERRWYNPFGKTDRFDIRTEEEIKELALKDHNSILLDKNLGTSKEMRFDKNGRKTVAERRNRRIVVAVFVVTILAMVATLAGFLGHFLGTHNDTLPISIRLS
eukprot:NODE_382_length_8372_cov_0.676538.p7 type:complete len:171 gc:universal NODE_382_length_8372_cov_0.676538:5996-5484(-)